MVLRLPTRLAERLRTHARSTLPRECCGALVGRHGEGWSLVERLIPLRNVAATAESRYEIDPAALLRLHQRCLEGRCYDDGLDVLGYYHSHPFGCPAPSESDRAAAWPDLSYLIASIDPRGRGSMKSWRLVDDRFVEERLSVEQGLSVAESRG